MKKWFGKKQVVLGLMVLLLGTAIYLNYFVASKAPLTTGNQTVQNEGQTQSTRPLGQSQFVGTTVSEPETYFDTARRTREEARDEAIEILEETLRDVKNDAAVKEQAVVATQTISQAVKQEDAIESLIKAKGFADCVVYIENEHCHVAVKASSLDDSQTLQILQVVTAQSEVKAENVSIVAVE